MRELVVRAQATHYLFHRKGEKTFFCPQKIKQKKKAMKPTNSWETTSFPMAYFHERSWKMERIFTRKRREKQLDAEQSLECLGGGEIHLTTVASKKKLFRQQVW